MEAGLVDVVVVCKIDQPTRSLTDFSDIVENFDRHSVSFVSITRQCDSTASMGRLTMNILRHFAQFEREVTGERIREKNLPHDENYLKRGYHPVPPRLNHPNLCPRAPRSPGWPQAHPLTRRPTRGSGPH